MIRAGKDGLAGDAGQAGASRDLTRLQCLEHMGFPARRLRDYRGSSDREAALTRASNRGAPSPWIVAVDALNLT